MSDIALSLLLYKMEQGRRPDQMEYSAKASFYCVLIAFILAMIFLIIQPIFGLEFSELSITAKNLGLK